MNGSFSNTAASPGVGTGAPSNGAPPMMDDDIIGVIKIKDGLFICDEFGA
jgi:hypothetical protein